MTEQEACDDPEMKVILILSGFIRELKEGKDFETTTYKTAEQIVKLVPIPDVSPSALEFKAALTLLRDLADIQNGAPLVTVEEEWKEIMDSTYDFLEKHEG